MKYPLIRTLLMAAALVCACTSFAQDAAPPPVPAEAPPRVPFSAFRMKPILEPQLDKKQKPSSLVIQDIDAPYKPPQGKAPVLKAPAAKPKIAAPAPKAVPLQLPPHRQAEEEARKRREQQARETPSGFVEVPAQTKDPVTVTKLAHPVPVPKPVTLPEGQPPQENKVEPIDDVQTGIQPPKPVPLEELVELDRLTAQFAGGVPLPAKKPTGREQLRDGGPSVIERILATPSEGALPRPPVTEGTVNAKNRAQTSAEQQAQSIDPIIAAPKPVPQDEIYVPVPLGESTERIRDRKRRFGVQDRMAGEGAGLAGSEGVRMSSLGLPPDLQGLRVGKLDQADGISPVLLPGHTRVVAAPDALRIDKRGVPAEVIVFFRENSPEMEVGQMDILATDVVAMMKNRPDLDLEIIGYAEPQAGGKTATRKMALARAIMVRDYISRQRISDRRLTVKAEGDETDIEPRDRVEMYFSR